jgi:uncharacterized alpha-E superfamily protein
MDRTLNRVSEQIEHEKFPDFFDWVKDRSHLFRGVTIGNIPKDILLSWERF